MEEHDTSQKRTRQQGYCEVYVTIQFVQNQLIEVGA